jgi:O-antigen/teichoic acid export membrane protein
MAPSDTAPFIQQDDALLRRVYAKATQAVALAYWPALAAVIVVAPQIIDVVLEDGSAALWPLRLLAVATLIKAAGTSVGSIFLAKGRASSALYWSLFSILVLVPTLWLGVNHWGLIGACIVIAATAILFLLLSRHLANRLITLSFGTYLRALIRPLLLAFWVGAVGRIAQTWLPQEPMAAALAAAAIVAAAGLSGLRLLAWDLCLGMWNSARGKD